MMAKYFDTLLEDVMNSLKFYASKPDPKTRKGGFGSRKLAIEYTKKETVAGPKVFEEAYRRLGWKK